MSKPLEPYRYVIVESYYPDRTGGLHGHVHIRPVPGQGYPKQIAVECPREMVNNHPVGTRFRIKAKLTDRKGRGEYLYSHHSWPFEIIDPRVKLSDLIKT